MAHIDVTNSIEALKVNLLSNEEFYINGEIDKERYIYMKDQIEMHLHYYLSLFSDDECDDDDDDYPCDIINEF